MRRRLPPMEQIQAFLEAADAPSFRVAAERCALSPAAFSRRIQAFSTFIGEPLFERLGAQVRLTDRGRRCADDLRPAYAELRRAIGGTSRRGDDAKVTVSLSHSLAVGWLIPRLAAFERMHPDLDLALRAERTAADVRQGAADIAVCFADVDLGGLCSEPLLEVVATPVAAPEVAAEIARDPARLADHKLLAPAHPPHVWRWWSRETGTRAPAQEAMAVDVMHALYELAAGGRGVALAATPTVLPHLESGRLREVGLPRARFAQGYRLAASPDRRRRPAVQAVWDWLAAEAERTPVLA